MKFDSKEKYGNEANPKHRYRHPTEENVFIVPNHKKGGDYYENINLSHLKNKL